MEKPIPESDLYEVLKRLREIHTWAVMGDIDPWAFRQALVTVFEMNTAAALERGVSAEDLNIFDEAAREKARELIRSVSQ